MPCAFQLPRPGLTNSSLAAYSLLQAMSEFNFATISHTAEQIRSKSVSPVEVVSAHLARAQSLHPKINAFSHIDSNNALAQARAAEKNALRGEALGPLHGIPLTIKSCIDVAGWPCPAGSLLRRNYIPSQDAVLVSRLKSAGAILLGNTNTPEFLMAYETNNLITGKTSNPWNLAHSSGGSSGGEAAAIAAGCSMGGVGSDGGGSIRVPAHFCGICGLKPTPGRIPATGHFPPGDGAVSWLGVVGPLARTVADVRALFEIMAGPDASDALSAPTPLRSIAPTELRGLRIGILESGALGAATPETLATVQRAAKLLSENHLVVKPFKLLGLDEALDLWWFFFGNAISHLLREYIAGRESEISPVFHDYLDANFLESPVTLDRFLQACTDRDILRAKILRQLQDVSVLISPVSSTPAFPHGGGTYRPHTGYRDTMGYSQWLNLAGFPGVSLPLGTSPDGLPIGVQIIGRPHEEELVLAVAETLETSRGPWRPPPISPS
jgi:Asp-tRNA(Asn)/Glu-tRNA(Gln) amidotransferase A subunit family amidase